MADDPVQVIWYNAAGEQQWVKEIPPPTALPREWVLERVARIGYASGLGGKHVIAWEATRECGCVVAVGYRLDTRRQMFAMLACHDHEEEMGAVYKKMATRSQGNLMDDLASRLDLEILS